MYIFQNYNMLHYMNYLNSPKTIFKSIKTTSKPFNPNQNYPNTNQNHIKTTQSHSKPHQNHSRPHQNHPNQLKAISKSKLQSHSKSLNKSSLKITKQKYNMLHYIFQTYNMLHYTWPEATGSV